MTDDARHHATVRRFERDDGAPADLWERVRAVHRDWSMRTHTFHRRLGAGELDPCALARFAAQYRHVVVALSQAAARACDTARRRSDVLELEAIAAARSADIPLWDQLIQALDGDDDTAPTCETAACVEMINGGTEVQPLDTLVVMHAIETAHLDIATGALPSLITNYGLSRGSATAYFDRIVHDGGREAETLRALIDRSNPDRHAQDQALHQVGLLVVAEWVLLDSFEQDERLNAHSAR